MAIMHLYYQNVAANAVVDLMTDGAAGALNGRFIRRNSRCSIAIEASAAGGAEYRVFTQNRTIIERSVCDGGGTDGVYPNLNEKAVPFAVAAGEILTVEVREIAGAGTVDVMGTLLVNPG
jgi:hypothetical protein